MSATAPRRRPAKSVAKKDTTAPKGEFTFTTDGGDTITLPPFGAKPGVMRRIRKLSEADQFFTILEKVLEERRSKEVEAVRAEMIKAREADGETDVEVTTREAEKEVDPDRTLEIIDDLETDEFMDLQREWFEFSGIDLGE